MDADVARVGDDALFDLELRRLLEAVMLRYRYDFRDYALSSMRRRVRLAMEHFGCASLVQLQDRVLREPGFFTRMLQYFTVHVSEMFRDPGYFEALREQALPMLASCPSPKVWVAGCSTGEEAWSMAILLAEEGLLERTVVYATDIDPAALRHAANGVYALERIAQFSRNYLAAGGRGSLSDHYRAGCEEAVFSRHLKARMVFANHSLATDSAFSEVQLVSCRNVLIYFDRPLQDRAIGMFREALADRGFLGVGARETLRFGANAHAFEPVAGRQRLYRKR